MLGADAVLLIAAILSEEKLLKLSRLAASLGLFCLTEVHNEEELQKSSGANVILSASITGI